jgi:hypothetical protein
MGPRTLVGNRRETWRNRALLVRMHKLQDADIRTACERLKQSDFSRSMYSTASQKYPETPAKSPMCHGFAKRRLPYALPELPDIIMH